MFKLTIPCGWDADLQSTLVNYPPDFQFKPHLHLDYFRYLGHLPLYLLISSKDDLETIDFANEMYVNVNKRFLDNIIPDYRKYLDYLVLHGLILENKHYIVNQKSGSLAYPSKYSIYQFEQFECTRITLVKNLVKIRKRSRLAKNVSSSDDFVHDHLSYCMSQLRLDTDNAERINKSIFDKERNSPADYIPESNKRMWSVEQSVRHIIKRNNIRMLKIYTFNNDSSSSCVQDGTSGRFHSKLTRLDKPFRRLLSLNGTQRLEEIDIKNSQIFLLLSFLDVETFIKNNMYKYILEFNKDIDNALPVYLKRRDKLHPLSAAIIQGTLDSNLSVDANFLEIINMYKEYIESNGFTYYNSNNMSFVLLLDLIFNAAKAEDVIKFKSWVLDGRFYENFMEVLKKDGYEFNPEKPFRSQVKEIVFTVIFGKSAATTITSKSTLAFKNTFPTVYHIIGAVKCGSSTKPRSDEKKSHTRKMKVDSPSRTLACSLQSLESEIVLNTICREIIKRDDSIPLFTIHDSIITVPEHIEYVKKVMNDAFFDKMGCVPQLSHNIEL